MAKGLDIGSTKYPAIPQVAALNQADIPKFAAHIQKSRKGWSKILPLSEVAITARMKNLSPEGICPGGFTYSYATVLRACSDLLNIELQAERSGPHKNFLFHNGNLYATINKWSQVVNLSPATLKTRLNGDPTVQAKDSGGRIQVFYSQLTIFNICNDLLNIEYQAETSGENMGFFRRQGERYSTATRWKIWYGINNLGVDKRFKKIKGITGKDARGKTRKNGFYTESTFLRICADVIPAERKVQSPALRPAVTPRRTKELEIPPFEPPPLLPEPPLAEPEPTSYPELPIEPVNFIDAHARYTEIGNLGEQIVIRYEKNRLKDLGRPDLAANIVQISLIDPPAGYDILSYDEKGQPIKIEIKTTPRSPGKNFSFHLSQNQKSTAENSDNYFIYLVFAAETDSPVIHVIPHPFRREETRFSIQPTAFLIKGGLQEIQKIS